MYYILSTPCKFSMENYWPYWYINTSNSSLEDLWNTSILGHVGVIVEFYLMSV